MAPGGSQPPPAIHPPTLAPPSMAAPGLAPPPYGTYYPVLHVIPHRLGVTAQAGNSPNYTYGYRTDNKKPPVTYRFLNLSVILDFSPGVFLLSISSRC